MQRFEPRIGQLGLVGGIRQERSDLITVVEPSSPLGAEARKGRLYLLVETEGDTRRALAACQLAARVVRRVFYEDETFSVTSALRAAVRAANKAIYEQNFKLPIGERAQVGISCAVLREGDLYVAQVQPAQAYVLSEGRLRALPAHPSWDPAHVSAAPFARSGALGASLFVEPELYRCPVRPGGAALLCSSNLAHLLPRPTVEELLRQDDPHTIADALATRAAEAGIGEVQALALTLAPPQSKGATPSGTRRDTPRRASRPAASWLSALGADVGRLVGRRPAPEPQPPASRPDPMHTMPEQPAFSPTPPSRPAPVDIGESLGERYERNRRERPDTAPLRESNLPPSTFLGEDPYPARGAHHSRRIDLGEPQTDPRPFRPRYEIRPLVDLSWGERLALPFRKLALGVGENFRPRRGRRPPPAPRPIPRGQGLSYRRTKPPFPWALLVGLVLVVSALFFYGLTLTRQNDQDLALEYFAAADQRLVAVRDASDETVALEALELARQAIDEVRASPNVTNTNPALWLRYQELQREYERALAAVQRVTFFDTPTLLATHPSPTGRFTSVVVPPALANITDTNVLEGLRYIYALDSDELNARLYRIPRDGGTPEAYLSPNQSVGTAVVGPVRAALWRIDQAVAVDQAPSGFGYYFRNNGSWNYSKLGGSEIWTPGERLDIEEYQGNLYVWGAQPDEVLKFPSGRYGDTPEFWINPATLTDIDLSTVVDMDVDGSIYLLRADGSVMVFSLGQLVGEVQPEAITPPIGAVTGFFVTGSSPEDGHFYLVDALNERVIQMEKSSGRIVQQIKLRADDALRLDSLETVVVDASGSRPILYLANGGQLIRAELPAPPRPFREQGTATPATPTP